MRLDSRLCAPLPFTALFLFALLLFPELALAAVDSMGTSADHIVDRSMNGIRDLLSGIAYLGGAFFGVRSAVLLRDHTENPGNVRLSKPLMAAGVSTSLLSLPGFYSMVAESIGVFNQTGLSVNDVFSELLTGKSASGGGNATSLDMMAQTFAGSIPGLMRIVNWGAYVAGAFLMLRAIFMLPNLETGREAPSKVIWTMFSGVGLWSLLPMVEMTLGTQGSATGAASTILTQHYSAASGGGFNGTISAVLAFVQFIGLIAFVRGMLILKALGENKDGAMGRAMTHLLAGAAAINITWTVGILAKSIGAQGAICGLAAGIIC